MPVNHEIDEQAHVITMTVTAPVTPQELIDDYQKIFENRKFKHNMNAVWDVSGLDLESISLDHIRQLPRQMKHFAEQRGTHYKAALVSTRGFDFQLLRLYVTILRLLGNVRFKVFKSMESAYAWARDEDAGSE